MCADMSHEDLLVQIVDKIDDLKDVVHSIDVKVEKNTISLDEHMKRTSLAEERLDVFEERVLPALDAYKIMLFLMKCALPIITAIGVYYKIMS